MRNALVRAAVLLAVVGLSGPAAVAEPWEDLGLRLEATRGLALVERGAALHSLVTDLETLSEDGLSEERKTAARLLSGEIAYEAGDGARAHEHFRRAAKTAGDGPFADDAAFADEVTERERAAGADNPQSSIVSIQQQDAAVEARPITGRGGGDHGPSPTTYDPGNPLNHLIVSCPRA